MTITQFLFTLFCTVGFCLGWRIITDKGQLLYFLRKPFDLLADKIEINKDRINAITQFSPINLEIYRLENRILIYETIIYLSKPVITCITCLSSVLGVTIFATLNGLSLNNIHFIILNSVMAAFIQTFIWNIYDKYL
ncbi:MAG: hypothetical protein V4608_11040 [Bacteroidota bacterium]